MDFRKCQTSTATPAEPGDLPYWFRAGSGVGEWGLENDELAEFRALRPVRVPKLRFQYQNYEFFRGSLGAEANLVRIMGPRPGSFKGRITISRLNSVLEDVSRIVEHDGSSTGLNYHLEDVIKYQGPREQADAVIGVTDEMWATSLTCLCKEYRLLGAKRISTSVC